MNSYTSNHFMGGTSVMSDPFSSLRPQYLDKAKSFEAPLTSSRYVDELRSFNVNDYLPCPKDKLDVKLHFSYGDEFRSYLGRDPQLSLAKDIQQSLGRESSYSPRTYQPTVSMINLNTSYKDSCPAPAPVQRTMSTIDGREKAQPKKPKTAPAPKKGKTPDLNNNFFKDARGKFGPIPERWTDCQVHNRIEELARPKQLPCEYKDNRRSVYWMTKRPPPKEEGCNHTHFETSCRLDELAEPKVICGEFCGERHCCWECEYPQPPVSCIDPRSVDWNRLACPKRKYPPNGVEIQPVKRAALKAKCSKRISRLALPVVREAKPQPKAQLTPQASRT